MSGLESLVGAGLSLTILVFCRIAAFVGFAPMLGERTIPPRVKLVIALGLTALVVPTQAAGPPLKALPLLMLAETAFGLGLAMMLRIFMAALQMAATIIAQSASLAQAFPGVGDEVAPPVASVITMLGLTLAVTLGLHLRAVEAVILLFQASPPGLGFAAGSVQSGLLAAMGKMGWLMFALAAGCSALALAYNLAIGFANRAMPQLMLTMIAAPIPALGALLFLMVATPVILQAWLGSFPDFLVWLR